MKELIPVERIAQKIYVIREQRIMLDFDLAEFYSVETKQLTRQVRRNIASFPEDFMFVLNREEYNSLRCQIGTLEGKGNYSKYLPYAFTELGVAMLSSVLKSNRARQINISIMRAFVKLRRYVELGKEASIKLREHDIKLLTHGKKLKDHENSINVILSHLIGKSKEKKEPSKKFGFRK